MLKVGVIGAGTMGSGIAQAFAEHNGYDVVIFDSKPELSLKSIERIKLRLERSVAKGKIIFSDLEDIFSRINVGLLEDLYECDLVIEAAVEDIKIKKEIFTNLSKFCHKKTIFATNTSSLSITEICNGLDRPVVGMHFFNPAETLRLVEVIAGLHTPRELVDRIVQIARDIGKTPVEVQDAAGFVVNRILIPMINEAIGVFADKTASAEAIDSAMQLGASHPMGPLALGDLIGLDVCLAIMEVLQSETGEDKYRPHALLRKMVRGGWLGRKSSKGFFEYSP